MLKQPNPATVHLPGAATAAQFCWRGAQPTSATAWARGKNSQHREFGGSFALWRTLEGMFQDPVLAFVGAKLHPPRQVYRTKQQKNPNTQNPKTQTEKPTQFS